MASKRKLSEAVEEGWRQWKQKRLDYSKTLSVIAGPECKPFSIHTDIICKRSPFFAAATSDRWYRNNPIDLTTHDSNTVGAYLQCLYQDTVAHVGEVSRHQGPYSRLESLVDVYLLADEIGDLWSTNKIIDAIVETCETQMLLPRMSLVERIYECTPDTSPLRRLVIDYWVFDGHAAAIELAANGPPAFVVGCLKTFGTVKARPVGEKVLNALWLGGAPRNKPAGHYHQHDGVGHVFCCLSGGTVNEERTGS